MGVHIKLKATDASRRERGAIEEGTACAQFAGDAEVGEPENLQVFRRALSGFFNQ